MSTIHRREFMNRSTQTGLGLAAGLTILSNAGSVRGAPANEKVMLALVGSGGRGNNLTKGFNERTDCEFAYVCDCDSKRGEGVTKTVAQQQNGKAPKFEPDFRKMLEDKSVDAVVIATPDHWHAPATVWACQAGKDVYVEKPPTHNCWEGQKMIEAARKYKRIVEVGTQNRSAQHNMDARKYIADGKLGAVHYCRILNQKSWPNFPILPDSDPPAGLNWDMWNGPAPDAKYNANFHRKWNHFWRYSSGDIINDAIHQIDLARWLLGVEYPKHVYSTGARFEQVVTAKGVEPGAAESPDTQTAVFQFDNMVVNFELTLFTPYMLKISPQIRESLDEFPYWPQCATHIEIFGTKGVMFVGRHGGGWQVFDRPQREVPQVVAQGNGKFPDPEHKENFIKCVRSREMPNADIREGHISTLWSHYATMSYRLGGEKLVIDPKTEQIVGNDKAMAMFRREYRKPWVVPDQV